MTHSEMVLANLKRTFCKLANSTETRSKWFDAEEILRIICETEANEILGEETSEEQKE